MVYYTCACKAAAVVVLYFASFGSTILTTGVGVCVRVPHAQRERERERENSFLAVGRIQSISGFSIKRFIAELWTNMYVTGCSNFEIRRY
jgi:hypothetical protein